MRLDDHDLSVVVEAAASGTVDSRAAHHGGPDWAAMDAAAKNIVREHALPFIFHGAQALEELGYSKPRMVYASDELDSFPEGSVILAESTGDSYQKNHEDEWFIWGGGGRDAADVDLPATVLHIGGRQ